MDLGYNVEVFVGDSDEFFNMKNADPVKYSIANIKSVDKFKFNDIPIWHLRIMHVPIMEHSHRMYYIQYNTESRRHRLIVRSPEHQKPRREELQMVSDTQRSLFYQQRKTEIDKIVRLISDDKFWNSLNSIYNETVKLNIYVDEIYKKPESMRNKYIKYKTKYMACKVDKNR